LDGFGFRDKLGVVGDGDVMFHPISYGLGSGLIFMDIGCVYRYRDWRDEKKRACQSLMSVSSQTQWNQHMN
jgi:hypothetical protein